MILKSKKILLSVVAILSLVSVNAFSSGWVTDVQKWCVYSKNDGTLTLNTKNALRYSGKKKCSSGKCNNSKKDYLKQCKAFVHADCYRAYRKSGKKTIVAGTTKTGFHKGKDEGGSSNNHYWNSMIKNIKINGAKSGRTIRAYDSPSCKGKYSSFKWK